MSYHGKGKKSLVCYEVLTPVLSKILLPQFLPLAIALIPANGKDDAAYIHKLNMFIQKMAAQLKISLIATGADGTSSKLGAQCLMDKEPGKLSLLVYNNDLYGLHLQAPVFKETGLFISHSNCPPSQKTGHNKPQHRIKTVSFGDGYVVNQSFMQLCNVPGSGLVQADVDKVDKQIDGAAHHAFHFNALKVQTREENGVFSIKPELLASLHTLGYYSDCQKKCMLLFYL
jgi:hypothetical protein